jgi:hypothetical protein
MSLRNSMVWEPTVNRNKVPTANLSISQERARDAARRGIKSSSKETKLSPPKYIGDGSLASDLHSLLSPDDDKGVWFDYMNLGLIIASVAAVVLESDPAFVVYFGSKTFDSFELITTVIFTLEYGMRLAAAPHDPRAGYSVKGKRLDFRHLPFTERLESSVPSWAAPSSTYLQFSHQDRLDRLTDTPFHRLSHLFLRCRRLCCSSAVVPRHWHVPLWIPGQFRVDPCAPPDQVRSLKRGCVHTKMEENKRTHKWTLTDTRTQGYTQTHNISSSPPVSLIISQALRLYPS